MLPPRAHPDFAVALKQERLRQGLSISELARRAQVNRRRPEDYEKGVVPGHRTWEKLNKTLFPGSRQSSHKQPLIWQFSHVQLIEELERRGARVTLEWLPVSSAELAPVEPELYSAQPPEPQEADPL